MRSLIGARIEDLDTPALLLDAAAMQRNLRRMADYFRGKQCQLRPHFKNHKCVNLARQQRAAGSIVGFTCAKLGEAEVLAEHGFDDILIANQIVGAPKINRLIEVARKCRIAVAVDCAENISAISQAASSAGVSVGMLVEVDLGMARCGVQAGEPALELARLILSSPAVRFQGIQGYEGHTVNIKDAAKRDQLTREAMQRAVDTRSLLQDRGMEVGVISGGASSTYATVGPIEGFRELQCGTYATMDWHYQELVPEFEIAMSILTRVISRSPDRSVLDIGVKGAGGEFGVPKIKGHPEVQIPFFLAEEHCAVRNVSKWRVGDVVEMIPSHACTTSNLHRQFFVHEAGRVVDIWPVEASGKLM